MKKEIYIQSPFFWPEKFWQCASRWKDSCWFSCQKKKIPLRIEKHFYLEVKKFHYLPLNYVLLMMLGKNYWTDDYCN